MKIFWICFFDGSSILTKMLIKKQLKEKGFNVLILEKGHDFKNENVFEFSYSEMRKKYNHGGLSLTLGNQLISYVEGSCIGGGSEVNSGLYHQTPENILLKWSKEYSLLESDYSKLSKYDGLSLDSLRKKIWSLLSRRGFDYSVVNDLVREIVQSKRNGED